MKKQIALMIAMLFLLSGIAYAQTIKVSGTITDSSTGEELIGVVIVDANNPNVATTTDIDGKYVIDVDKNATLKISYLGYVAQQIKVNGQNVINIVLGQDSFDLETVVVVGVLMKKSDLTGAVGSISSEKLAELPVTSVNEALQGRVAGVHINRDPSPGGVAKIKIRGSNSISFGNDPIYVVDGIILDGGFNLINPEDIASLEVLKDASATSLYGSRAANGVVVITTKRGKKGGKITYDAWIGSSDFAKKMKLMNTSQIRDLRIDAFASTYVQEKQGPLTREQYIDKVSASGDYTVMADYEQQALLDKKSYDWLDEATRNGFEQNHSLSFSDADDKGSYYLSLNYTKQDGLMKTKGYERFSGKVNIDRSIRSWLKIGTTTSYTRGTQSDVDDGNGNIGGKVFWNSFFANPFLPINDEDVIMKWGNEKLDGVYNPRQLVTIDGKTRQNRVTSANFVNINPIKGLNIRNTISIDFMDEQKYKYTPIKVGDSQRSKYDGDAMHEKKHWFNWQYDGSVSYETTLAEKHKFFGMFAVNISKNKYEQNKLNVRGFPNDDLSYYNISNATLKDKADYSSDFNQSSLAAFVQRINYTYDSRYYATITVRQEGSSKIASNNRWSIFPSVALAWNAANEKFVQELGFFDQLKLRLGYGVVGNQGVPLHAIYSLYNGKITGNNIAYVSDGRLGNPNLKWEKQKQTNVGIDVGILKNRLSLNADYYFIKNSDLLMKRSLRPMTGYTETIANVGEIENSGFEFTLNGTIIESKDFSWHASANISFNKNKVKKLFDGVDVIWKKGGWTNSDIEREGNLFVGKSLNSIYTYKFDRIIQESDMAYVGTLDLGGRNLQPGDILPMDTNGDKIIDDRDKIVVGKTDPKYFGGFSTDVNYKGIGLNVIFNYSVGAKKISGLYEALMRGNGMNASHKDLAKRWTPQNTNTNVPSAYRGDGKYGYGFTDLSLQDASFLRMGAITLSYDLPKTILNKVKIQDARIYFTGNNLLTITDYKGYDPELGDWYPPSKMYVVGLRLGF